MRMADRERAAGREARVEVRRGGRLESVHRVHVAVASAAGDVVAQAGDALARTYWRSAAKPFQVLPFVACGGAASYGFGPRELALMASSHNGEEAHRGLAASILAAAGLEERHLLCGAHLPLTEVGWRELAAAGASPTPLWNNCSGKHAGMLAHCRRHGWPVAEYRLPDHPLQAEIRDVVARASGEARESVGEGVDGCGVPAFHLSLRGMATAYARLADPRALPDAWGAAARELVGAMAAEPYFLAGTGRLCTRVAQVAGDRVVAKVGAEGVFCAALRDRGWGLAVKAEDGSGRAAMVALLEALRQLGVLREDDLAALGDFTARELRNHAGTVVGEVVPWFRLAPA